MQFGPPFLSDEKIQKKIQFLNYPESDLPIVLTATITHWTTCFSPLALGDGILYNNVNIEPRPGIYIFFAGLECVGHPISYVAHYEF